MRTRRGFLIIFMLPLFAGMLLLATVGLSRSATELLATTRYVASQQAFHRAEAGVDAALLALKANPSLSLPASDATLLGSTAGYTITDQGDGTLRISATGSATSVPPQTINAVVGMQATPLFRWAAFTSESVYLQTCCEKTILIDSYDASQGPYDPAAPKQADATIQTNRTTWGIIHEFTNYSIGPSQSFLDIWGDEVVGVGGNPQTAIVNYFNGNPGSSGTAYVHGVQMPAPSPVVLPPIIPPSGSPSGLVLNSCPATPDIAVGTFNYSSLLIPQNCQINLVGDGVIHLNELRAGDNSLLRLNGNLTISTPRVYLYISSSNSAYPNIRLESGSAEFYVNGTSGISGNLYLINETKLPKNLALYVQGVNDVWLTAQPNRPFYGVVYAPESTLRLLQSGGLSAFSASGPGNFFGSFIGRYINTMRVNLHYDRSLKTTPMSVGVKTPVVRAWRQP